jgi:hypothetical protein
MMHENLFLGECPIIRPEGIYYGGRKVIALNPGLQGVGVGDAGDLLAYRQMWEPFISAHLQIWRDLNDAFEQNPMAQQCPTGIFDKLPATTSTSVSDFCNALSLTRRKISPTDPGGILTQWNAWKDKSAADIVAGAPSMLAAQQNAVMRVGRDYANQLREIEKNFHLSPVKLPDVPSFSAQQELRARIEGAYITTKGVLQLIGYGVADELGMAADVTQAVAKGLKGAAEEVPNTFRWVWITATIAAVVVGGALIMYYVPHRSTPTLPEPQRT